LVPLSPVELAFRSLKTGLPPPYVHNNVQVTDAPGTPGNLILWRKSMKQLSPETMTQLMIWGSALLGLISIAAVFLGKLRGSAQQSEDSASQLLSNLQDLRQEGDISDTEYRTIKAVLGAQLQQRAKDDPDKA